MGVQMKATQEQTRARYPDDTGYVERDGVRCGAGRRMDSESDGPVEIATAIAQEIGRPVEYRPVETDGAARAARLIANLL